MDTKKTSKKSLTLKHPHAETDLDNDSDQTLFSKFIVLESTPITKLCLFIIEKKKKKKLCSKPKSVKKNLANNTLLVEVTKETYSDLLEQKSFYVLKIKSYPSTPRTCQRA